MSGRSAADLGAVGLPAAADALATRIAGTGRRGGDAPYGLTGRELEVLRLVALGRSNAQIAEDLFISPKTVSVHVSSVLAKLQASSRTQAVATAQRTGLLRAARAALTGPPRNRDFSGSRAGVLTASVADIEATTRKGPDDVHHNRAATDRPALGRLTTLVAAAAAAAALSVGTTASAAAATAEPPGGSANPILSGSGCVLVQTARRVQPEHQQAPGGPAGAGPPPLGPRLLLMNDPGGASPVGTTHRARPEPIGPTDDVSTKTLTHEAS